MLIPNHKDSEEVISIKKSAITKAKIFSKSIIQCPLRKDYKNNIFFLKRQKGVARYQFIICKSSYVDKIFKNDPKSRSCHVLKVKVAIVI